jgi:quercetin dioxygenase-like cupin family protein
MNVKQEDKAWGRVRHIFDTPQCAVSVLEVERGGYSSRHFHEYRVNRFLVQSGCIEVVEYDGASEKRTRLNPGDVHDVNAGIVHKFDVIESGIVVEVYWPAIGVSFKDIKRLDIGGLVV